MKYYLYFIDDETNACSQNALLGRLYQGESQMNGAKGKNTKFSKQGMA